MTMNPVTETGSLLQPDRLEGQIGGSNASGASVNMFRGDVMAPLTIASLPGFQDVAITITAVNESNIFRAAKLDNAEAPASILGLGWSLPRERILALGKRSLDIASGSYCVENSGKLFPLILIENRGETYLFATNALPLWQFLYEPGNETWTITMPDGGRRRYGERLVAGACEWGLSWNGWIGASTAPNAAPYAVAWNLVRIENSWGVGLAYGYVADTLPVGTSGFYTRATYLSSIIDDLGQAVELHYADKENYEWVCPHLHGGQPDAAYQDRYETKFLDHVVEYSSWASRTIARTLTFDYAFVNFVDPAQKFYRKRLLVAAHSASNGIANGPPTLFAYNTDANAAAPGALAEILNPAGAKFRYQYKRIALNSSNNAYFNKSLTIEPPVGFQGARPYVMPSDSYMALTWLDKVRGTLALQIYNFGGAWSAPWMPSQPIKGAFDADGIVYAQTQNLLALFVPPLSGTAGGTALLLLLRRDPYQLNAWRMEQINIRLRTNVDQARASLVAGDNFIALAIAGQGDFHIFDFDPAALTWKKTSFTPGGENVVVATDGSRLVIGAFTAPSRSLSISLYSRALDRSWSRTADPISKPGVAWNDNYVGSLLNCGPHFAAVTYVDGTGGKLTLLEWNAAGQFAGERTHPATSAYTSISQSVVMNGPRVFRYDAGAWKAFTFAESPEASYAIGEDFALRTMPVGAPAVTLIRYQPTNGSWIGEGLAGANAALFPPTLAGNVMTCGTKVYRRQPDETWQHIADLSTSGDPATLVNRGNFVIYGENLPNGAKQVVVLLLGDAQKVETVRFGDQKFGGGAEWFSAAACAGLRAFATYPKNVSPLAPSSLVLHRILDNSLAESQTDDVIGTVTTDDGYQKTYMAYDYDTVSALFDPTGQVVQYPHVTEFLVDAGGNPVGGWTEATYYNGLPIADNSDLNDYHSLMTGREYGVSVFTAEGLMIFRRRTEWRGLSLAHGDASKVGVPFPAAMPVIRAVVATNGLLRLFTIEASVAAAFDVGRIPPSVAAEFAAAGLPLEPSATVAVVRPSISWRIFSGDYVYAARFTPLGAIELTSELSRRRDQAYDDQTGALIEQSTTNRTTDGKTETITSRLTYAWTLPQYAGMLQTRQFGAVAETRLTNVTHATTIASSITTWGNEWGAPGAPFDAIAEYAWNGAGELAPAFNFADPSANTQWVRSTEVVSRAASGIACVSRDALGVPTSQILDVSGVRQIATFQNADIGLRNDGNLVDPECSYVGFEDYERHGPWRAGDGGTITRLITTERAHTGRASLKLSSSFNALGIRASLSIQPGTQQIALNYWLLNDSSTRSSSGFIIRFTGGATHEIPFDTTGDGWQRFQCTVMVPAGESSLTIEVSNAGAQSPAYLDDLMVLPLPGSAEAWVYDADTLLITAQLDANAATTLSYYDESHHALASTNARGQVIQLASGGYSRQITAGSAFDPARPNTSLVVTSATGGTFDTLKDNSWRQNWTPLPAAAWTLEPATALSGRLMLLTDGPASLTWANGIAANGIVCRLRVTPPSAGWRAHAGLRIAGVGAVEWDPTAGVWRILDVGGAERARTTQTKLEAAEWLLTRTGTTLALFLDGQPIIAAVLGSAPGPIEFFCDAAAGLSLSGPAVLLATAITLDFSDGLATTFQSQSFDENGATAQATLKDVLGRQVVTTKPMRYDDGVPGLRTGLVAGFDWSSGAMSGEIARYYDGRDGRSNDQEYPYTRVLLEMSPIDRQRAMGQAGLIHAIYPGAAHFTETPTITNLPNDLGESVPPAIFIGNETRDADGSRTRAFMDDRLSEFHRRFIAPLRFGPSERHSARRFNARGQLTTMLPPMALTTGDAAYAQTRSADPLGNILRTYSSDCGEIRSIYDSLGRARFTLVADGVGKGANGADRLVYMRYDPLGRVFESGTIDHVWDPVLLKRLADTDWPTDGRWEARITWDCFATIPPWSTDPTNTIGRTVEFRRQQIDETVWTQQNAYDADGNIISISQRVGERRRTQHYAVNAMGELANLTFETDTQPVVVTYRRNLQGKVVAVGDANDPARWATYSYTATALPAEETLNVSGQAPLRRRFSYNSLDLLTETESAAFSEALSYWEKPGVDGATYFEGQVARAVFTPGPVASAAGLTTDDWSNAYDAAGNISAVVHKDGALRSMGSVGSPISYDANDNMLALTERGETRLFTIKPGTNQLVGMKTATEEETYQYSPGGNLIAATGRRNETLSYNLVDGLVSESLKADGSRSTIDYGTGDERVRTTQFTAGTAPGADTHYLHSADGKVLAETRSDIGNMIYIPGPFGFVAVLDPQLTPGFVIRDRQNSTRLVMAEDGKLLAGYAYDPFGSMAQAPVGPWADRVRYLFIGQEYDPETGLYNLNARLYDPVTRRFLSPDPLRSTASPYPYVSNIPFQASDPTGLIAFLLALAIGAVVGAVLGGGVSALTYAAQNDWKVKDWGGFWKEVGIGAAVGFVTGPISVLTGGAATAGLVTAAAAVGGRVATFAATTAGRIAVGVASGAISGAAAGASGQVVDNAIRGKDDLFKNVGWSVLAGAGIGALFGGATSAFYFPGPRGPGVGNQAGGDRYAAKFMNAGSMVRSPRAPTGAGTPIQTNSFVTWRDVMQLAPRGTPNRFKTTPNINFGLGYRSNGVPRSVPGSATNFEVRFHSPQTNIPALRGGQYWTAKVNYGTNSKTLGNNMLHEGGAFHTNTPGAGNFTETHLRFRFWSWT
jgi:RHS repeat-associated protein